MFDTETSEEKPQALCSAVKPEPAGPRGSEHVRQRLPLARGLGHHLLQAQRLAQLLAALLLAAGGRLQRSCSADTSTGSDGRRTPPGTSHRHEGLLPSRARAAPGGRARHLPAETGHSPVCVGTAAARSGASKSSWTHAGLSVGPRLALHLLSGL